MTNNIAMQLNDVMISLWDAKYESSPVTKALVSFVRSHANHRNVENVFEVIDVLWSDNVRTIKQRDGGNSNGGDDYGVDIQFDDDSQVLVACRCGIGHGLEFIS